MFEDEHERHNLTVSEIAPMALFALCANLCRKLKISPKEFGTMLNDIAGAKDYLEELLLAEMQRKIDERKKGK